MTHSIALSGLLLLFAATPLAAQVYRWVDANGDVHYSDTPPPAADAKEARLPDLPVVNPPPVADIDSLKPQNAEPEQEGPAYPTLTITSPAAKETVWADDGRLKITISTDPPLRENHVFIYKLDGKVRAGPSKKNSMTLTEVFRGEHTISVAVVNTMGDIIQQTPPSTVYVRHHSILN